MVAHFLLHTLLDVRIPMQLRRRYDYHDEPCGRMSITISCVERDVTSRI